MSNPGPTRTVDLTIVVSGGAGSAQFQAVGKLALVCTDAPTDSHTYDYLFTDPKPVGIAGRQNLTGDTTIEENKPCLGLTTMTLLNATDGVYSIRLYQYSDL